MAINFPNNPINGDTHVVDNITYTYDSAKGKWDISDQSTVYGNLASIGQSIIPNADEQYDLGSGSFRWRDLYLSGTTIDLGGLVLTNNGGTLELDGTSTTAYSPTTPTDWNGTPPTTISEALDRLAAVVKTLNGGTGA
jgi:hypothetical protein